VALAQGEPIDNVPMTKAVGQTPQESVRITVNSDTLANRGAAMYLDYYNSSGEIIGGDSAAPYGPT